MLELIVSIEDQLRWRQLLILVESVSPVSLVLLVIPITKVSEGMGRVVNLTSFSAAVTSMVSVSTHMQLLRHFHIECALEWIQTFPRRRQVILPLFADATATKITLSYHMLIVDSL